MIEVDFRMRLFLDVAALAGKRFKVPGVIQVCRDQCLVLGMFVSLLLVWLNAVGSVVCCWVRGGTP